MEQSDGELLKAYTVSGSADAFAELAKRYEALIFGTCRRTLWNHHDAEEAAQAVLLAILEKAQKLAKSGDLSGWLYATSRNTALSMARAHRRRRQYEEAAAMEMSKEYHDKPVQQEASWDMVASGLDEALMALPGRHRRAIILRYLKGMSLADVAARLDVPQNTATSWVMRGLERLRKKLGAMGITTTAEALDGLLEANKVVAPPTLIAAVMKMAAAGIFQKSQ